MESLLIGGAYGLLLVIAFFVGAKIGEDIGRDSALNDAAKMIADCCCKECFQRLKEYPLKEFGKKV